MNRPWMPLYVADYLADTAHLSAAESGAYLHLIMHYWLKGGLPTDHQQLAKIARMSFKQFNRALPVIAPFFGFDWSHKRIDQELEKARDLSEKRRDAVAQRKDRCNTNEPTNVEQLNTQSQSQLPTNKKTKNTPLPPSRGDDGFALFWEVYPLKVGKGDAVKAWKKALKKTSADEIVSAVKRFAWPDDKKFIPHPASWLNAERWADEAPKPVSFTPAYRPPVFVPPPPDPTMTPEHRERMAAKFDDLLKSLGKSKEM